MNNDAVYTLCGLLKDYLINKYNCKVDVVSPGMGNTLSAYSDLFDIYIRCIEKNSFWPNRTIVLANIKLRNQRRGEGSDLLQFLNKAAKKLNYCYLGIEQANVNSASFAKNLGFHRYKTEKEWLVSVDHFKISK